jgi:hypothetical protein
MGDLHIKGALRASSTSVPNIGCIVAGTRVITTITKPIIMMTLIATQHTARHQIKSCRPTLVGNGRGGAAAAQLRLAVGRS